MVLVERITEKCEWEKADCSRPATYCVLTHDGGEGNPKKVGSFCRNHAEATRKMLQTEEDATEAQPVKGEKPDKPAKK